MYTQRLPRKQRDDVALELRELLREELQSRANAQARTLDKAMALEGLRAIGAPRDVAARYVEFYRRLGAIPAAAGPRLLADKGVVSR